jgi:hypothetical protein
MQTAQARTIRFVRRGSGARRKAFDVQLWKGPRDIGEKTWPFGLRRRAEKVDYGGELTVSVADRRIDDLADG